MAVGYTGRCAQNCKKIVQKIIQNNGSHHRWRIKVTQIARIARKGAITDGVLYGVA